MVDSCGHNFNNHFAIFHHFPQACLFCADYLPVLLEFAAERPEEGRELLTSFRPPLELIRAALHDRGSLYAGVLDALCEALPRPTARQLDEARRLAEEGPPAELVGACSDLLDQGPT